ncbi:MAG: cephalosporin hydroxylase family protein [Desulfosalsimonadaceae bacterium]|nr:cephalosporin hydroxylase family protein [Desulfosalsimonadaceae bacterium]
MSKETDPVKIFEAEKQQRVIGFGQDEAFNNLSRGWLNESMRKGYTYNFSWMGRPVIQYPTDMVAMQEIIWAVRPDLIIETGIAHGGSLMLSASMLAMLDYCDAVQKDEILDPRKPKRRVLGIDIDIRAHNRGAIMEHPLAGRIDMIEGSSIGPEVMSQVHTIAEDYQRVMVCLDSMHTHDHVLAELEAYGPLTSKGSYCVVFDTFIEDAPGSMFPDRPWTKGNNPKTAVWEFLRLLREEGRTAGDGSPLRFEMDRMIENKLLITAAPDGFLKRI